MVVEHTIRDSGRAATSVRGGTVPKRDPLPASAPRKPKEGRKWDIRVVGDLVAGNIPIRDKSIVGVGERCVVGHDGGASVGVFAVGEELLHGIQGI